MGLVSNKKELVSDDLHQLNKEELEILLMVLQNSMLQIPGGQIQKLHTLIWKLQEQHKNSK